MTVIGMARNAIANGAAQLRELTGARARVVWVQDLGDGRDVFARGDRLRLMGLDTDDGLGERPILESPGPYAKPLLTPDGEWVVFTDHRAGRVRCVPFAGGSPRDLAPGFAADVWRDPRDGRVWVYAQDPPGKKESPIVRFPIDDPAHRETVWDRTPVSLDNFQLSADGTRAVGMFPWPAAGLADLTQGTWQRFDDGCWTSISPDNTYRFWIFLASHREVRMYDLQGPRIVEIDNGDGWEVYHPRWSNHPRIFVVTGPYVHGQKGANNIRGGGRGVEIHAKRFDATFSRIEASAQVTHNDRGDFFPDLWVEGAERHWSSAAREREAEWCRWVDELGAVLVWKAGDPWPADRGARVVLRGAAHWTETGELELTRGAAEIHGVDEALLRACRASNELTIEVEFVTHRVDQKGPARIVSFSCDAGSRNFTLGQVDDRLVWRVRTPSTGENGSRPQAEFGRLESGRLHRVRVAYRPGQLRCWLDGREVEPSAAISGDFSNWTPQGLILGDEWTGERDWHGRLRRLAIYAKYKEEAVAD